MANQLQPIVMFPSYRYGDMTPWGGKGLQTTFGKPIPDERTGEALEISAIPSLNSVTTDGITLGELIDTNGEALVGKYAQEEFPLLLKFISANESLSVQVHPDDDYAGKHENKLGKSEAWVILSADEGASILYGIKEGVTTTDLQNALENDEDIEPMIERVPVKAGDVFYMPAGMVHAIGGGIVLYEIQQSSDVTYRLWDYNRTNAQGEKRELHLQKALDVILPELGGIRTALPQMGENGVMRLLDVKAFTLDCVTVDGSIAVPQKEGCFGMLSVLSPLTLHWQNETDAGSIALTAGMSVLLPASCENIRLEGKGQALVAMP